MPLKINHGSLLADYLAYLSKKRKLNVIGFQNQRWVYLKKSFLLRKACCLFKQAHIQCKLHFAFGAVLYPSYAYMRNFLQPVKINE